MSIETHDAKKHGPFVETTTCAHKDCARVVIENEDGSVDHGYRMHDGSIKLAGRVRRSIDEQARADKITADAAAAKAKAAKDAAVKSDLIKSLRAGKQPDPVVLADILERLP